MSIGRCPQRNERCSICAIYDMDFRVFNIKVWSSQMSPAFICMPYANLFSFFPSWTTFQFLPSHSRLDLFIMFHQCETKTTSDIPCKAGAAVAGIFQEKALRPLRKLFSKSAMSTTRWLVKWFYLLVLSRRTRHRFRNVGTCGVLRHFYQTVSRLVCTIGRS